MKLIIVAALIAVSAAGRLEHLEQQQLRAYLPPYGSNSGQRSFGAIAGAYGTDGPGFNGRVSYPAASDRYLPPNYGSAASSSEGVSDFAGSINGFGAQSVSRAQQYSSQYGQQNGNFGVQSRFQSQPSVSRQYLAPSSQNYPQQSFDEQTGYHY